MYSEDDKKENSEEAATEAASSSLEDSPEEDFTLTEDASPVLADLTEDASLGKEGKIWEVVVIREGLSLNGRYYTREALEESIPLWEDQEVCVYGYDPHRERDHVPQSIENALPEGTFANNVGFLREVQGRERDGRYELFAHFVCTKESLRKELVERFQESGKMPGFSIHARGETVSGIYRGRTVNVVTKITETKELTLVSKPAAGGIATRLVAGQTPKPKEKNKMNLANVRAFVAGNTQAALRPLVEAMEADALLKAAAEQLQEMDGVSTYVELALEFLADGKMEEAIKVLEKAMGKASAEPEMAEMADEEEEETYTEGRAQKDDRREEDTVTEAVRKAENTVALFESRMLLKEQLREAKLPKVAEDRIRKQFAGKVFTESEVKAEIDSMNALLSLNTGGEAAIEGQQKAHPSISILVESEDKFQACMDLFVLGRNYDPSADKSLSESERQLYKDMRGTPQTRSIKRLYQESANDWDMKNIGRRGALTEAVTNTTFSGALGNSYTLKLQKDFRNMPAPDWQEFVEEVEEETLLQRDRVIVGGIGLLPTVAEGGTYQDLSQPAEYTSNYSLTKRGGYIEITEEAILNDRVDFIRGFPDKLRNAAIESEKTVIYKALIGNLGGSGINTDTSYTGAVHYIADHDNYSTTALSNAGLVQAKLLTKRHMVFSTETALNEASNINSSVTSFDVDDASGIRSGMYIRIESEWMEVTGVSSNTLTVVRGSRGSTAASHNDNVKVFSYAGMLPWEVNGGFSMCIIVPTELEDEAHVALGSKYAPGGGNNDVNTLYRDYTDGRIKVVPVDSIYLGGDTNNWYTSVPWRVSNGLEVGYLGGERIPQLINQTQDAVGQVFLADTMRFKVKHRVGANNMFHEGRTGHIVS